RVIKIKTNLKTMFKNLYDYLMTSTIDLYPEYVTTESKIINFNNYIEEKGLIMKPQQFKVFNFNRYELYKLKKDTEEQLNICIENKQIYLENKQHILKHYGEEKAYTTLHHLDEAINNYEDLLLLLDEIVYFN